MTDCETGEEVTVRIRDLQRSIEKIYGDKDRARGLERNFLWFMQEVGELAELLLENNQAKLAAEFADVLAWLVTLASITGVDLENAAARYRTQCPRCAHDRCTCPEPGS